MMKLLLVEDEKRMAMALMELLQLESYEVILCMDGITGNEAIESDKFDIIILDVMLPGMSGFAIAKQARKNGIKTPILMLSAKSELDDKVQGLDCGADDYLTKPFMPKELFARLRALKRRMRNEVDDPLRYGDLILDHNTSILSCSRNGQSVRLSEKEYHIMEYFMINHHQLLQREQLALKIWGYEDDAEYNKVEVYLSFVRKKLSFLHSTVEIKALRGLGYQLRNRDV